MGKVMTSKEFIEKLRWLVNQVPNVYYSGKNWSKLNSEGKWQFDCVVSVKSILWGFKADKNLSRGGTVYGSNGVADFTCNGALNYCSDVSTNFANLIPGEYLCMKDTKYNHTGIYLGNGKVFEDTTGWGTRKAIISDINSKGERFYEGRRNLKWTYHGKLNYIDYSGEPQPINQVKLLQAYLNEQWNCGLATDGLFGPATTKACSQHNLYKGINAPIMVGWLQTRLTELGYSVGPSGIDRHFGPATKRAVESFQKDRHLGIDGIVGKATYRALTE